MSQPWELIRRQEEEEEQSTRVVLLHDPNTESVTGPNPENAFLRYKQCTLIKLNDYLYQMNNYILQRPVIYTLHVSLSRQTL